MCQRGHKLIRRRQHCKFAVICTTVGCYRSKERTLWAAAELRCAYFPPHYLMSLLQRLRPRFKGPWPTASLRTYLLAVILLATLPVAGILSFQIYRGVRTDQAQIEEE